MQVGKIKNYKNFQSAFIKDIYLEEAQVDSLGILNDEVADKIHHGGYDKAIFANASQNYPLWEEFLNKKLQFGMMGENLSIDGLCENNVCIGDIHQFSNVILQVSEPRKPCVKISKIHKNPKFTHEIFKSALGGWYYRVLQSGTIQRSGKVKILEKNPISLSVFELNQLFYSPHQILKQTPNLLAKLEQLNTLLSQNWHESIHKRLKNTYDTSYMSNL